MRDARPTVRPGRLSRPREPGQPGRARALETPREPAAAAGVGAAAVEKPFHVRRLHATVLKQLGFDPNELSYFYRGLDQRLVGVEGAEPIHEIIA